MRGYYNLKMNLKGLLFGLCLLIFFAWMTRYLYLSLIKKSSSIIRL